MSRKQARSGFTLIELLTVLAVFSVVTTIGTVSFVKMATMWRDTAAGMELNAKCVNILEAIRDDLERVASAKRTGLAIVGEDRLEKDKQINRHIPQDDRIRIPVFQRKNATGPWQQFQVRYHIDRDVGRPTLVRTVGAGDEFPAEGGQDIAEGATVTAMNITYLTKAHEWVDSWSNPELPAAVRVSISVALQSRPHAHVSREAVIPIHVR